tara:strand:- start:93 stop:404 length:312 start_codon:yes stop_codon:yes gene_type:complete
MTYRYHANSCRHAFSEYVYSTLSYGINGDKPEMKWDVYIYGNGKRSKGFDYEMCLRYGSDEHEYISVGLNHVIDGILDRKTDVYSKIGNFSEHDTHDKGELDR